MNLVQKEGGVLLRVKVVPNSSRTQFAGMLGDAVKIKVAQPPEDGKANDAVVRLIAEALGIAPSRVSVTAGHTRPQKEIQIAGLTVEEVDGTLAAALVKKQG
jgi:uncharacterized protein (TIGR00251 family)